MSEAPKTVWVTKYALTKGLVEQSVYRACAVGYHTSHRQGRVTTYDFVGLRDCADTREAALTRANEMKAAKIASLKRQIAKLESLEF
jgi:hypothetical protein